MEDKSGSGVCDWCDRPGHEAIDCIRRDPVHFDKGVCILCNNRLHGIDECLRFEDLDLFDQAELLVDIGRMKPGVRSVGFPWVSIALYSFSPGTERDICLDDLCPRSLFSLSLAQKLTFHATRHLSVIENTMMGKACQ